MIQKLKAFFGTSMGTLAIAIMALVPVFATTPALAAGCNQQQTSLEQGINDTTGSQTDTTGSCGNNVSTESTIGKIASEVVKVFSIIVGAASVIMIIYGGFRYITSGGDSGKITSAKNTLIYAIIGLIIVALAQFIVHFVINTAINQTSS